MVNCRVAPSLSAAIRMSGLDKTSARIEGHLHDFCSHHVPDLIRRRPSGVNRPRQTLYVR
jgi:hypothetical protein